MNGEASTFCVEGLSEPVDHETVYPMIEFAPPPTGGVVQVTSIVEDELLVADVEVG